MCELCEEDEEASYLSAAIIPVHSIDKVNDSTRMILSMDKQMYLEASFSDFHKVWGEEEENFAFFEPFMDQYGWLDIDMTEEYQA